MFPIFITNYFNDTRNARRAINSTTQVDNKIITRHDVGSIFWTVLDYPVKNNLGS